MKFYYEGHDARGQVVMGEVEAESEGEAAAAIRSVRGHYAREISASPVKTQYHHSVVAPKDAEVLEAQSSDWIRDEIAKEIAIDPKPCFASAHDADVPLAEPDPKLLENNLRSNMGEVALALRTIDAWHAQWSAASSTKSKLPPDVPDLGGKTWEFYKDNLNWLGKELMLKAIWAAMSGERLG